MTSRKKSSIVALLILTLTLAPFINASAGTVGYFYDAANRLIRVAGSSTNAYDYTYDIVGNRESVEATQYLAVSSVSISGGSSHTVALDFSGMV